MEMDTLEKLTDAEQHAMQFLRDFLGFLKELAARENCPDDGIAAMQHWVVNGHAVNNVTLDKAQADEFAKMMKKNRIPFTSFEFADGHDEKVGFVFRDIDVNRVSEVLNKDYRQLMDNRCKEMDLDSFYHTHKNDEIAEVDGLSITDVYAFREASANHDINFTVTHGEHGSYQILADDKDALQNVLMDMSYNLTSPGGEDYRKNIETYVNQKKAFVKDLPKTKDDERYLVDLDNPHLLISVNGETYLEHVISIDDDGSVANDRPLKGRIVETDMTHLTDAVTAMGHPVMLTKDRAESIIEGTYKKSNELKLADNYLDAFKKLKEQYKAKPAVIERIPRRRFETYDREELVAFCNVTPAALNKIKKMELDDVCVRGADLALTRDAYEKNKDTIDALLYDGLSPLQKEFARLAYIGAARIENVHKLDDTMYLCNADSPGYVIRIDNNGYDILQNGEMQVHMSLDDPGYEKSLCDIIDTIKQPVVLTPAAYESPEKWQKEIEERLPNNVRNEAVDYMEHYPEVEKQKLHEYTYEEISKGEVKEAEKSFLEKLGSFPITSKLLHDKEYTYRQTIERREHRQTVEQER